MFLACAANGRRKFHHRDNRSPLIVLLNFVFRLKEIKLNLEKLGSGRVKLWLNRNDTCFLDKDISIANDLQILTLIAKHILSTWSFLRPLFALLKVLEVLV